MFYFRLNTNKCPGPRWFGLVTGYRSFHLEVISYIQSGSVRPKAAAARQRPAPARNGLGGSVQMGAACPRRAMLCRAEQGCSCPLGTFTACPEPWGCATGAHIQQQGCVWPGAVLLKGKGIGCSQSPFSRKLIKLFDFWRKLIKATAVWKYFSVCRFFTNLPWRKT